MIVNLAQLAFFKNQINEGWISNEFSDNPIVNHFRLVSTMYIPLETFDFVLTSMYFYDWKIKMKYKRQHDQKSINRKEWNKFAKVFWAINSKKGNTALSEKATFNCVEK